MMDYRLYQIVGGERRLIHEPPAEKWLDTVPPMTDNEKFNTGCLLNVIEGFFGTFDTDAVEFERYYRQFRAERVKR